MAEGHSITPRMETRLQEYCATPESWEMRADMQTPSAIRPTWQTNGVGQGSSPWAAEGMVDSFNDCFSYDMYETPPGAVLYRNHFDMSGDDGSFNTSFQAEADEVEVDSELKLESRQENVTNGENIPPGIQDEVMEKIHHGAEVDRCCMERVEDDVSANRDYADRQEAQPFPECSSEMHHRDPVISVSDHSEPFHILAGEGCKDDSFLVQEKNFKAHGSGQKCIHKAENEECILERMDEHLSGPVWEDCEPSAKPRTISTKVIADDPETISACSPLKNNGEELSRFGQTAEICSEEISPIYETNETCTGKSLDEHVGIQEVQRGFSKEEEANEQQDSLTSCVPSNEINTLMHMDIPQDATELNQLADFLKMEDPFQDTDEKQIAHESNGPTDCRSAPNGENVSNVYDHKQCQIEPMPSPKKARRRKKTSATSERRRSVRIACRQSIQCAEPDLPNDGDIINSKLSAKPMVKNTSADLDNEERPTDLSKDTNIVHHPFPDVGEGSPGKCDLPLSTLSQQTEPHQDVCSQQVLKQEAVEIFGESISADYVAFNHSNIDLPMTKRRPARKNSRRRSTRMQRKDLKLNVSENVCEEMDSSIEMKPLKVEEGACDKGFLADFADFGLGDDWMPGNMFGESQFAKTPKKTPGGRRKSARLSGVPISLLELHSKSTVKVSGADGVDVDEDLQNRPEESCLQPITEGKQPQASIHIDPSDCQISKIEVDLLESLGDLPFEHEQEPQSKRGKKRPSSVRRRSVRLAKKPPMTFSSETDDTIADPPNGSKKTAKGRGRKKRQLATEAEQRPSLQELHISDQNTACSEAQQEAVFAPPKVFPDETDMEWQELRTNKLVEPKEDTTCEVSQPLCAPAKRVAKDTPFMGRKRVSRIQDKENDEPEPTPTQQVAERSVLSPNNGIKITKKIKQLYLNKGQDAKKHKAVNLETIFESPAVRGNGLPPKTIGGKRMKRTVAFTETPWLGRPGRSKGRKTKKKVKAVPRVLSSRRERCWKLDTMLSTLDDLST